MGWIKAVIQLPPLNVPVRWKWVDHTLLNVGVYAPMNYSHEFRDYYVWDGRASFIDPQTTKDCYWYLEDPKDEI